MTLTQTQKRNGGIAAGIVALLVAGAVVVANRGPEAPQAPAPVTVNGTAYTSLTNLGHCKIVPNTPTGTTLSADCRPPATAGAKVLYAFPDAADASATVSANINTVSGTKCSPAWIQASKTLRVAVPKGSLCKIKTVTFSQNVGSSTPPPTTPPTSPPPTSPPPTSTPPPTGTVSIAAAGDIADNHDGDTATSNEVIKLNPDAVLTIGDTAYPDNTIQQINDYFDPTWGRFKNIIDPVPGNHEYHTSGASGYFSYFGAAAHPPLGYYTFKLGAWQVYALNSMADHSASSAQVAWLKQQLAANPSSCILAYYHHPRYSSDTTHGDNTGVQTFVTALEAAHADVILNGHSHTYERFAPKNGIREFVVGTGGGPLYKFGTPDPGSEVRLSTWGVISMTLSSNGYTWQFKGTNDQTLDSGSGSC